MVFEMSTIATNSIAAIVILLLGFILAKVAGRFVQKLLHEAELDKILRKAGAKVGFEEALAHAAEYVIYFITVVVALNQLGITTTVLYFLAGALVIVLVLSVFLGIKDFIPNFMAGLAIYKRELFKEGKTISVNGITGKVVKLSLLETRIKTAKKDIISLPNSLIIKSKVRVKK